MTISGESEEMRLRRLSKEEALKGVYHRQCRNKALREFRGDESIILPNVSQCHYPRVMFVGELLSIAYQQLSAALVASGLYPTQCYFTTLWKHRLNGVRPTDNEYGRVLAYVEDEIAILKPRVVVPVGQDATTAFLETEAVGNVQGQVYDWESHYLIPIEYPGQAYVDKEAKKRLHFALSNIELHAREPKKVK